MDKLAKLMQDIAILWDKYHPMYLRGMLSTLGLALAATAIGCIIGLACGILNTIPCAKNDPWPKRILLKILRVIIRIYVEVFRGTPMMLQAVFIFYALPYFTDNALRFDNIWAASILIVSINTGAYMAESVRGGIISIDPGQTEGAKAIGMTHFQTMTSVILPQAIRNILPQIGNNYIINVKDTSVMFIIGFTEFFASHRYIRRHRDGRLPPHDPDRLRHPPSGRKGYGWLRQLRARAGGSAHHDRRDLFAPQARQQL